MPPRVLPNGGHAEGPEAVDVWVDGEELHELRAERVTTVNTHGTGCSLSSAPGGPAAAGRFLVRGRVRHQEWLTGALAHADELSVGHGPGPVHHFWRVWGR